MQRHPSRSSVLLPFHHSRCRPHSLLAKGAQLNGRSIRVFVREEGRTRIHCLPRPYHFYLRALPRSLSHSPPAHGPKPRSSHLPSTSTQAQPHLFQPLIQVWCGGERHLFVLACPPVTHRTKPWLLLTTHLYYYCSSLYCHHYYYFYYNYYYYLLLYTSFVTATTLHFLSYSV
ncbi:hypothetical protein E2C01_088041 [Portunus trituberculatus]|uniref:Uncharacterized protein n=1 Tax=Portunus trituberculatus TaxID=210409 RepID=A0A5B7JI42_PORTR|nr:hypothetical protein [Portunus trituberculatus]